MVHCSRTARGPYDYNVVVLPGGRTTTMYSHCPGAVRVQCSRTARAVRLQCTGVAPVHCSRTARAERLQCTGADPCKMGVVRNDFPDCEGIKKK